MRRTIAALLLLLGAAHAAPLEKPPESLDLVHQLERIAAGKPLPVVVAADQITEQAKPVVPANDSGLLPTLQDLGDAFSSRPVPDSADGPFRAQAEARRRVYQPFAFDTARGRLWTVANARMWVPTQMDAPASPSMDRLADARTLFASLEGAQLAKAGGAGLRWTDLTPVQQAALRRLIGGPWAVSRSEQGEDGRWSTRYLFVSEKPLDLERCTLRLYIGFGALGVTAGADDDSYPSYALYPDGPELARRPDAFQSVLRMLPQAPHVLKPSDLDYSASALARPLGIQGVSTVGKVVAKAAALSGLPLEEDARWSDRAVFIGDAAMEAGDVLRALAFATDGAWRRVGGTYLFTWDRAGLATEILRRSARYAAEDAAGLTGMADAERAARIDFARGAHDLARRPAPAHQAERRANRLPLRARPRRYGRRAGLAVRQRPASTDIRVGQPRWRSARGAPRGRALRRDWPRPRRQALRPRPVPGILPRGARPSGRAGDPRLRRRGRLQRPREPLRRRGRLRRGDGGIPQTSREGG